MTKRLQIKVPAGWRSEPVTAAAWKQSQRRRAVKSIQRTLDAIKQFERDINLHTERER